MYDGPMGIFEDYEHCEPLVIPRHVVNRIMMSESGWVFLPQNNCGWYDEFMLRAIADELERRNTALFADFADFEANDPLILEKLEEDASF